MLTPLEPNDHSAVRGAATAMSALPSGEATPRCASFTACLDSRGRGLIGIEEYSRVSLDLPRPLPSCTPFRERLGVLICSSGFQTGGSMTDFLNPTTLQHQ